MYETKEILVSLASVLQVVQFLSGILVCRKFVKRGSSNDVSALPFICGYTSCVLWANYGMMINDLAITGVNIFGGVLFFIYAIILYLYNTKKNNLLKQKLYSILFLVVAYGYKKSFENEEIARERFGLLCCALTLVFFAAPLANLAHVIRTKSSESLPFPIILMSMIVTLLWSLYGLCIEDNFVIYPNALGFLLSCFQLSLFVIYPSR